MTNRRKKLYLILGIVVLGIVAWTFDPKAWLVRLRFPSARVMDLSDYGYSVPAFLHAYLKRSDDLYDGTYLWIEISNRTVDLNQLRGIPFCFLILHRCKISDLRLLREMNIVETNRVVSFDDCDLTAVPRTQFGSGGPGRDFYQIPADPKHFTDSNGP